MKKYLLILGLLTFLSCKKMDAEPSGLHFYFENPQPMNDGELSKIPNKFQGLFVNSDSVYTNVQEKCIVKEFYNKFRFPKKDFDSIKKEYDKVGNSYVSKLNQDVYDATYFKDSIEFSNKQIDTFFIFSKTQKAKRNDGKLILNYKDSIYWKIKTIRLEKNSLKIQYMISDADLKRMDSVTKVKSKMIDSSSFIINPSRNEFKRILRLKNLGEEQVFKKIK